MSPKPAVLRERARRDVEEAVKHYRSAASAKIAIQFIDTLQETLGFISEQPAAGSSRYAHELDIFGLRSQKVGRFPHMIVYIEKITEIDVWRILHGARDIPAWLRERDE